MKTILITNRKGGVGKTTTSVNLAAWLGRMGKEVLVIDLDTQSHIQYGLGYSEAFKCGVHTALLHNNNLHDSIYVSPYDNVSFIPADINFEINKLEQNAHRLSKLMKRSKLKHMFDICIIDTPPTSDILLANALYASNYAIVPVKTEFLSLIGVSQFLKIFYKTASKINPAIELLGILPTMYNRSMKEHSEIIKLLEDKVGKERVLTPIRNDIKLSLSFLEGKPALYLDRRTRGSKDYEAMAKFVLDKLQN